MQFVSTEVFNLLNLLISYIEELFCIKIIVHY